MIEVPRNSPFLALPSSLVSGGIAAVAVVENVRAWGRFRPIADGGSQIHARLPKLINLHFQA
jgi:hypothetical protein